jgi:phage N-6-adenine-methyltransferase
VTTAKQDREARLSLGIDPAPVLRSMPTQKPGRSEQVVGTPRDLLDAVERRFGPIRLDLAANDENKVCEKYLGPGSAYGEDSLQVPWHQQGGHLWLNPPFADIDPWAAKCAEESKLGARISFLVPYTVADWFRTHVYGKALVLGLSPRVTFRGHATPYPKDLQLIAWGPYVAPGWDVWRWRK